MKKVYTAPSVVPCDLLKSVLESNGIPAIIKNERGSAMAGRGLPVPGAPSLVWAWPEIWVSDEDEEEALRLASEFGG
jgi:hypothetical protein